jgi:DNA repair protein SbcD/Mre11
MRILHFADLHLGVENYGRLDAATGMHTRLHDFLQCFDFIIDQAIEREVDLVLFCGDAFRSREPSPTLQCLLAERIGRLGAAGIPMVLIPGNHDLPSLAGRRSSLDIYPILSVPGVVVAMQAGLVRIETRSGPVQVACLPAAGNFRFQISDLKLTSKTEAEKSAEATTTEIEEETADEDETTAGAAESVVTEITDEESIEQWITEIAANLESDIPALLAGHVAVQGARVGMEGIMAIGREVMVSRKVLVNPAFSYVALGHVHRFQDLNPKSAPAVVYCGSLERVDFGEENEPKGFVLININTPKVETAITAKTQFDTSYTFIETPARRFVTVNVELGANEGTLEVLEAINRHNIKDAIVKVVVRSHEDIALEEREIRQALAEAAFVLPVIREVERPMARMRAPELAGKQQQSGREYALFALEEYLRTRDFTDARKEQLRQAAGRLVKREEG